MDSIQQQPLLTPLTPRPRMASCSMGSGSSGFLLSDSRCPGSRQRLHGCAAPASAPAEGVPLSIVDRKARADRRLITATEMLEQQLTEGAKRTKHDAMVCKLQLLLEDGVKDEATRCELALDTLYQDDRQCYEALQWALTQTLYDNAESHMQAAEVEALLASFAKSQQTEQETADPCRPESSPVLRADSFTDSISSTTSMQGRDGEGKPDGQGEPKGRRKRTLGETTKAACIPSGRTRCNNRRRQHRRIRGEKGLPNTRLEPPCPPRAESGDVSTHCQEVSPFEDGRFTTAHANPIE